MTDVAPIVGKPGIQSSELWVVVITIIGNFIDKALGKHLGIADNAQNIVFLGSSIVASVYALARAWTKTGTHKALALVHNSASSNVASVWTPVYNAEGTITKIFNSVTGDVKTLTADAKQLFTEEKAAAERAWSEQKAIADEARQDVESVVHNTEPAQPVAAEQPEANNPPVADPAPSGSAPNFVDGNRPSNNPR